MLNSGSGDGLCVVADSSVLVSQSLSVSWFVLQGTRCNYNLCKICCKMKCKSEKLDCIGEHPSTLSSVPLQWKGKGRVAAQSPSWPL